jgi:exodeoxyribonuclease V alpha subunit
MRIEIAVTGVLWCGPNGAIFSGTSADGRRRIVRLPGPAHPVLGEVYVVEGPEGAYVDDRGATHSRITATTASRIRTSGALVGPWLRTISGIGEERASRIIGRFGPDVLAALGEPSHLDALAGCLSPDRPALGIKLAAIVQSRHAAMRASEAVAIAEGEFYVRLEAYGVDDRHAARDLYRLIGSVDPWDALMRRSYSPACVLAWPVADHLGQRLLAARGDTTDLLTHPERLTGACDAAWRAVLARGDTTATRPELERLLYRLGVDGRAAVEAGLGSRRILRAGAGLRPPGAAWLERETASHLQRLASAAPAAHDWVPVVECQERGSRPLTHDQRRAILDMLQRPVSLLQGGAGTGKTSAIRVLADAWASSGGNVVLTALSGKAALRLARSAGRLALTLARLLGGLELRQRMLAEGRKGPSGMPCIDRHTMLVVDEASMVDLATWGRVLAFLPTGARLIAVGDVAQLPPVGLGQIFHDLVAGEWMLTRLTAVMRQSSGSPILGAAARIRDGLLPDLLPYAGESEGCFIVECAPEGMGRTLHSVRRELVGTGMAEDDILVVALRNATCREFCGLMQAERKRRRAPGIRLGPLAPFVTLGEPLVATRNRYEESLMNGLVGHVAALKPLLIRFDGEAAAREVSVEARSELMSAWALTAHRAQGSEARCIVVALDGGPLLTREWLYTAVTRATDLVVIVGSRQALESGVRRRSTRETMFPWEMSLGVGSEPERTGQ